jgi:calnexin
LYTLIVKYVAIQLRNLLLEPNTNPALRHISPDNTYEVLVNDESVKSGSLLEDFDPPVNPSKDIFDPTDSKPADWVDESQIVDTSATKVSLG